MASRDETWNRRTPGPATSLALERIEATVSMFRSKPGTGFGANIAFTVDEMQAFIDEWKGE